MSLGAECLRAVAETAVLNNNYMLANIRGIEGVAVPWPENTLPKLEQVRYSWEPLHRETGVTTMEIEQRMVDYGVQHYMPSHVPVLVPQPFTIEPGESLTIAEMDHMIAALRSIAREAYEHPETVRRGPHRAAIGRVDDTIANDPRTWAFTRRALARKRGEWLRERKPTTARHAGT
jgi:glycine dehydrogenase subunit 2